MYVNLISRSVINLLYQKYVKSLYHGPIDIDCNIILPIKHNTDWELLR